MRIVEIMGEPMGVPPKNNLQQDTQPTDDLRQDNVPTDDSTEEEQGPDYHAVVQQLVAAAEQDDGFTVIANSFEPANKQDGYQVALADYETRASMDDTEAMVEAVKEINAFINQHSSNDLFVGGWITDGQLCLDVSQYVEDFDLAMSLGKQRNQDAIWDNKNMKEIPVQ